jgi:hypothetical protein
VAGCISPKAYLIFFRKCPIQARRFRGGRPLLEEAIITSVLCICKLMSIDYRFISQDPPPPETRFAISGDQASPLSKISEACPFATICQENG